MSWRSEYLLETPENLRQFIKELINTELISEQQKFKIYSENSESTTVVENDPLIEMDFRHKEAKEINAANLAQMIVPKQQLIQEARRIVLQEEINEKIKRHQNAAFNRDIKQLKADIEKSNMDLIFSMKNAQEKRSMSATKFARERKLDRRSQSCTEELGRNGLSVLNTSIQGESSNFATMKSPEDRNPQFKSNDWHSDCENGSEETASSSNYSASTVMKRAARQQEKIDDETKDWLPPLNVSVKSKSSNKAIVQKSPKLEMLEFKPVGDREQLKKYWFIWRAVAFRRKNMQKLKKCEEEKRHQIENFVRQLESDQSNSESPEFSIGSSNSIKSKCSRRKSNRSFESKKMKSCSNLEQIIRDQKIKLREQEDLISKLKLEQIRLAAEKSKRSTQALMENSLEDSSFPVKRKLNYLRSSFPDILDKRHFEKPRPSFLVQMEKRHQERIERKKELRERTHLRILEQKRLQKEKEEARKAEIAEQKRLEQETKLEQMRLEAENRANQEAAREFCRLRRLRMAFRLFQRLLEDRGRRLVEAEEQRKRKLLEEAFGRWREVIIERVKAKVIAARRHHQVKLMRFTWNKWREAAMEAKRDRQVAEDYCDLMVQDRAFKGWRLATKQAYDEVCKKIFDAELHHERAILKRCWAAWKRYHLVVAEEKKTESKKESLRNAIRDVLPDFMPSFTEPMKQQLPNQL